MLVRPCGELCPGLTSHTRYGRPVLHPVGRASAATYWRRRLVIVALIAFVAVASKLAFAGGSSTAGAHALPSQHLTGPAIAPASHPSTTTTTPPPAPTPSSTTAPRTTAATPAPPTQVGRHTPLPSGAAPTPVLAGPCVDSDLRLAARTKSPTYPLGGQPQIVLTVTNTSAAPCTGDFGPRNQEVVAFGNLTRVWDSNDCYPEQQADVRTLAPGGSASYPIVWSGLRSAPGCAGQRNPVPAADYTLIGRIGTLSATPIAVTITRPNPR